VGLLKLFVHNEAFTTFVCATKNKHVLNKLAGRGWCCY